MGYAFKPARRRDAVAAGRWRYPPPYAHYDTGFGTLLAVWLLQPLCRAIHVNICYAVLDEPDDLVGLFTYAKAAGGVEIGLAPRPDLIGQGRGLGFVLAGLDFGRQCFAPASFRLRVATANRRAIAVYERAGFRTARTLRRRRWRGAEFLRMRREV